VNRQGTSYEISQSNYITVDSPVTTTETDTTTTSSNDLVAAFSGTPVSGTEPLTVQFTDSSSGSPDSWSWDFGDGSTNSDENPSHQYNLPGLYTVSLTITKSGETNQTSMVSYITVASITTTVPTTTSTRIGTSSYQSGTNGGYSQSSSTPFPTPVIRKNPAEANVTPVLTGQAWLDRENKKLADAEAIAASGQPTDIVSQVINFFKGVFSWL
jgi:PKD repeat protein